jgi:RND family efflux transporter MFP subunit
MGRGVETSKLDQLRIEREPETEGSSGKAPWWALGVLGVIAVAAAVFFFRPDPVLEVRTVTARAVSGTAASTVLNASGYVTARRYATVSSKLTGQVSEVLIEEGMRVEKGQVLATLDDSNVRRSHELALAQLDAQRTAAKETEALLAEARANLKRTENLVERQLASEQELDRARTAALALSARLERIRADTAVAERQVAIFAQQLEDTVIRAPFAGIVIAKNAQPGEMISPVSAGGGFTRTGIGTVVDMESLEIEIDVNEAYINRVEAGQPVTARLDAYPDWDIPGHVIAIIPTADRQRATVEVRVGFDALDPRILPDMGVKVAFQDDRPAEDRRAGVLLPRRALSEDQGRPIAWIVNQGVAERRAVATGNEQDDDVLVTAGLDGGERVILNPPSELVDGMAIKILN